MKISVARILTAFVLIASSAFAAEVLPRVGTLPAAKVLFLGNSITLHGPKPDIGWTGNWGMAASEEAKDYVHLVAADLARVGGRVPQILVRNIAGFEREYATFDLRAGLKDALDFRADIVVVAIGENVPDPADDDARTKFAAAFTRLLATLSERGKPAIFVRSCFWPHEVKDGIMHKAATDAGARWVDISALGRDDSNAARSERKIEHAGVAGHPGDKGMRAIADALFSAITSAATETPPPVSRRAEGQGCLHAMPRTSIRRSRSKRLPRPDVGRLAERCVELARIAETDPRARRRFSPVIGETEYPLVPISAHTVRCELEPFQSIDPIG